MTRQQESGSQDGAQEACGMGCLHLCCTVALAGVMREQKEAGVGEAGDPESRGSVVVPKAISTKPR